MRKQLRFSVECSEESSDKVKCKVDLVENGESASCTITGHDNSLDISCTGDEKLVEQIKEKRINLNITETKEV